MKKKLIRVPISSIKIDHRKAKNKITNEVVFYRDVDLKKETLQTIFNAIDQIKIDPEQIELFNPPESSKKQIRQAHNTKSDVKRVKRKYNSKQAAATRAKNLLLKEKAKS